LNTILSRLNYARGFIALTAIVASGAFGLFAQEHAESTEPTEVGPVITTSLEKTFIEGLTIIEDIEFRGLDEDLRDFGIVLDHSVYRSDFLQTI
jgi:hypothetical protein